MWRRPCVTSGESWLYVRVITRSLRVVLLMFNHQLSLQTELLFVLFWMFCIYDSPTCSVHGGTDSKITPRLLTLAPRSGQGTRGSCLRRCPPSWAALSTPGASERGCLVPFRALWQTKGSSCTERRHYKYIQNTILYCKLMGFLAESETRTLNIKIKTAVKHKGCKLA